MSHKIKQIYAPLRFTDVVLVCLIKVINISSEQKKCMYLYRQNYIIINQNWQNNIPLNARSWNDLKRGLDGSLKKYLKTHWYEQHKLDPSTLSKNLQNYCGTINSCIIYWGTTNLKNKHTPNKIVIKIFMSLGQFYCSQQHAAWDKHKANIGNLHFSKVIKNFQLITSKLRNKFGILPHVFNYHQNVTSEFFRFLHNIFTFTLTINWSSCYLEFESSQVKRQVFWHDITWLSYVMSQDPSFYLTGLHNKSFIELGSEAVIQRCSVTNVVLRNFSNFTGKHLCRSLLLMKLQVLRPVTLSKKILWHRCYRAILWI